MYCISNNNRITYFDRYDLKTQKKSSYVWKDGTTTNFCVHNDKIYATCRVIVKPKKISVKGVTYYKNSYSKKRSVYVTTGNIDNNCYLQIKYSKNKQMKKAKTYSSGVYLKKGTYYFRARAYVLIDDKKYYGNWGKIKKKRIK